ncbi:MAG: Flagellar brake protein YcgR [Herbaspirillum frisingense]|uniref:Flagellar brake protein YcgR n=1 Tax=Herbaspirillum frisingense TaxID=92645 RepID=A0A7V8JU37_9BURK|nr:MAG: Flagellar brake protein YcgR [Herbaspirillum frisingense]
MHNEPELEDARYQVSSKREIIALLSTMMKDNLELSIRLRDMEEAIATSILRMDEEVMFVKAAPDPGLNKAILESHDLVFAANPRNALIKFSAKQVHHTQVDEQFLALKIDIPDQLLRIQRREFFRIDVPPAAGLRCKMSFTAPDGQFNLVWVAINNISAGGVGITDRSASIPLQVNTVYDDCHLELGVANTVPVRLRVRSFKKEEQPNGAHVHHFGCEFVETPRAVLASIQRFILQLERELNAQKIKIKDDVLK